MKTLLSAAAALALSLAASTTAQAVPVVPKETSPTVGLNLSWVFGAGPAVGVRVLSTNEKDHAALSVGFDYMINSQNLRTTAGVAYLGHDNFLEGSIGYDIGTGSLNYGVGAGVTQTQAKAKSLVERD